MSHNFLLKSFILTINIAVLFLVAGDIAAAPAKMLNKTVRYSLTISAPTKTSDGRQLIAVRNLGHTVYISSQGRIFNREDVRDERTVASKDRGPDQAKGVKFRIDGNRLVGVAPLTNGAFQMIVTFDPDFRTCTLNAMAGAEGGRAVQAKGLNGITYTATGKGTYSNLTCSVTEGNAFGG